MIIHDSAAGDIILESGAIREIQRIYPTAQITLVVSPSAVQLAERCPYVDEVILNSSVQNHFVQGYMWNMQFANILLKKRFDVC